MTRPSTWLIENVFQSISTLELDKDGDEYALLVPADNLSGLSFVVAKSQVKEELMVFADLHGKNVVDITA